MVFSHFAESWTELLMSPVFGFAAALLEGLPVIGLVFTISNRVGAAMWAHGGSPLPRSRKVLIMVWFSG